MKKLITPFTIASIYLIVVGVLAMIEIIELGQTTYGLVCIFLGIVLAQCGYNQK